MYENYYSRQVGGEIPVFVGHVGFISAVTVSEAFWVDCFDGSSFRCLLHTLTLLPAAYNV